MLTKEHPRESLDRSFAEYKKLAEPYRDLWREVADFLLPTRPKFLSMRRDRRRGGGNAGNNRILNNTAMQALGIAKSGLLSQEASPAGVWFNMTTTRPSLAQEQDALIWLDKVRDILLTVFDRANFYNALGDMFEDELAFGTGAMAIFADANNVIRCEVFPIGSYFLANGPKGDVHTFCREFVMSARQVVERFGKDAVSQGVTDAIASGNHETRVKVRHMIWPNTESGRGAGAEYLPFHEIYWEVDGGISMHGDDEPQFQGSFQDLGTRGGILEQAGYHEFPVIVLRWSRDNEDVWSNRSPGIDTLGDNKQLQEMTRVFANGTEKMVNPPIIGGPGLEARPVTMVPGAKTIDPDMGSGGTGARELHQTRLPLRDLSEYMERIEERINRGFMTQYFLAILQTEGTPDTAEAVRAKVREQAAILGPINERHSDDGYDKIIDRVVSMLVRLSEPEWDAKRDGILPQPPAILRGEALRVRYVSETASQQRSVAISSVERHAQFVGGLAEIHPGALDVFNPDAAVRQHATANNVPPEVTHSAEVVAQIRAQREALQKQQAMMQAAPGLAKAAKDASETPTDQPDTALAAMLPGLGG